MATVSQTSALSGTDVRSWTLRSATTLLAVTCAVPLTRILPTGHDVLATSTVPTGGFGAGG